MVLEPPALEDGAAAVGEFAEPRRLFLPWTRALQVYKTQWSRLTRELGTTGGRPLEIQDLRTRYQKLYQESSSLDETGFLTRQTFLVPPDSKREIDPSSSTGPHSILAEVLGSLEGPSRLNSGGDKPSASLRQLLEVMSPHQCNVMSQRCSLKETILHTLVGSLQTQFVRAYVDAAGVAELAARRLARLGKRLYYAALETLLRAEEQHLSASDFNLLLQNEVFHSALLACCLEVVLFSCGTEMGPRLTTPQKRADSTRFPWILQAFKLQPYDFFKLLETFFKYLTASSEDLAQHLQELENQILQELAWSTPVENGNFRAKKCPFAGSFVVRLQLEEKCHRMLEEVYGDHALSKSQCYRWFKKFQSGDFELDNEPCGKPP
ncbi:RB1 [Cordylochernes scorpioides]|uniref:RB1 n=1 Tax=Cordylochernes scorpioides TaxID=51811 RepID=A0ABY6KR67_9ARAC|nr:RB1 [Cordylochernes scorpioides]